MACLIPALLIAVKFDFTVLYTTRSLLRLQSVMVDCLLMYFCIKLSIWKMFKNITPAFIAGGLMYLIGCLLRQTSDNMVWSFVFIGICISVYFAVLSLFKAERGYLLYVKNYLIQKYIKHNRKKLL
jgi:hypothetical protein